MQDLYLIYINRMSADYKGKLNYEFIFCEKDKLKGVDGSEWDQVPASGRPKPPNDIFIKEVAVLKTKMRFDVVQDSDSFAMWDAVDGVVALAWENMNDYEKYPEDRMIFRYGDSLQEVTDRLYNKELVLKFKTKDDN